MSCPGELKMQSNKSKISCKQGFTLIELLVVVLIIGILTAVAVPQYKKAVYKSRYATMKSLVATVSNAAEIYYLAHGSAPDRLSELDIDIPAPTSVEYDEEAHTDTANYPWGYCYLRNGTGTNKNFLFQCNNTDVNLGYIQRFSYDLVRPGTRACSALNEDAVAVSVCKSETQNTYYYQGDDGNGTIVESYLYQ